MGCKKKKIIFIKLINRIVIFFFCFYAFFFVNNISAQNGQADSNVDAQDSSSLRHKIEFDAQNARDPFKDYITPEEVNIGEEIKGSEEEQGKVFNPPALTIQGIIWGGTAPCAIINGEVKKEDESAEGVKILGIKKEGLELLYEGKKYSLPYISTAPKAEKEKNDD